MEQGTAKLKSRSVFLEVHLEQQLKKIKFSLSLITLLMTVFLQRVYFCTADSVHSRPRCCGYLRKEGALLAAQLNHVFCCQLRRRGSNLLTSHEQEGT